jgi:acyl carrier protein
VHRHFALSAGGVALVNEYGPTEATVWASYRRFTAPGPVSIGGPVPGANLYVLDESLRPVPRGAAGELVIGGAGVARGYLGRPDATSRAFIEDSLGGTNGARMYRTGDLVRWDQAGTLECLGRRDHQVKIRGHRVELGAVEAVLRAIPAVRDAVVVPDPSRTNLVGFLLTSRDTSPESIREHVAARVPAAMVPARFVVLDEFPHALSGKVDRARLGSLLDAQPPQPATSGPTPAAGGDLTTQVTAAWAEVLKASNVPSEANFFDLGGHSLTMFQLQNALERHTGVRPSIVDLFRHTTVSAQVALVRDGRADAELAGRRTAGSRRANALRARQQRARQEIARQEIARQEISS